MLKTLLLKRGEFFLLICAFLVLFSSCRDHYRMKLLVSMEDAPLMKEIVGEINSHSRFQIEVEAQDSLTETKAISAILDNEFAITTVDNTLDYRRSKQDIRTVIPFFHEVLVILSRNRLSQSMIDSLLRAGDYLVLTKEAEELQFFKKLIPRFTGDSTINYRIEDHFDLKNDLKRNELMLFFSGKENYELGRLIHSKEAHIYSFDPVASKGNGSFVEGFCQEYKKTTPYVLSRDAFGIALEKPIYTFAVHELLVTRRDFPAEVIYDLIETIHHHHIVPVFGSSNNYTFEVNQQDINLIFPFQQGTVDYLNRDQPKFVERYAEVMGFVLSAFVLLIGLVASLRATINQRKKDRMDEYYKALLTLKENMSTYDSQYLFDRLRRLQKKVFELLIDEKLSANNEFVIFMMLWDEIYHSLDHSKIINDQGPSDIEIEKEQHDAGVDGHA